MEGTCNIHFAHLFIWKTQAELDKLLSEERLAGATLLILANKQDLPGAMSAAEIRDFLNLESIRSRHWLILPCSASISWQGFEKQTSWPVASSTDSRVFVWCMLCPMETIAKCIDRRRCQYVERRTAELLVAPASVCYVCFLVDVRFDAAVLYSPTFSELECVMVNFFLAWYRLLFFCDGCYDLSRVLVVGKRVS